MLLGHADDKAQVRFDELALRGSGALIQLPEVIAQPFLGELTRIQNLGGPGNLNIKYPYSYSVNEYICKRWPQPQMTTLQVVSASTKMLLIDEASETVNNGAVAYQTAEHQIHAGDIILMHFRPAFTNDVIAALTAIHNAGLTPALLEDYVA